MENIFDKDLNLSLFSLTLHSLGLTLKVSIGKGTFFFGFQSMKDILKYFDFELKSLNSFFFFQ